MACPSHRKCLAAPLEPAASGEPAADPPIEDEREEQSTEQGAGGEPAADPPTEDEREEQSTEQGAISSGVPRSRRSILCEHPRGPHCASRNL